MARLTVGRTYSYYNRDGTVRVIEGENLHGRGRIWVDGRYEPPTYPSPLNVRVGDAGIKVWMAIQWLRLSDNSDEQFLARYGHILTKEDLEAARWFYEENKDEIDAKVREEQAAGS